MKETRVAWADDLGLYPTEIKSPLGSNNPSGPDIGKIYGATELLGPVEGRSQLSPTGSQVAGIESPNGRDLNPGIIGGTGLRAGEASNPFGNLMNTGEVSNGAVISANTVGNVDASKLPGAISPTIVHEERKVNGKTSGSTGGRVAAGIVRGSNSSTDNRESSGVYGKTEEAGEATSYAPGATGVVSRHVVEGNNVGAAKDLPVVTNQAGAAKGQSGHGEGRVTGGALVAAAGANKTSSALSTTNGRVAGSYAGAVRGPTSPTGKAANVAGNGIDSQGSAGIEVNLPSHEHLLKLDFIKPEKVEGRVRVTPPRERWQLRVVRNGITPWLDIFWGRNYIMLL